MNNDPTPKEQETIDALVALTAENDGKPPTLKAIGERMGITKAGVHRHVESLKRKELLVGPQLVGDWKLTPAGKKFRKKP